MKTFYSKALKYTAALLLCTATAGCTSFLDEKTYSFRFGRRPLHHRRECGTGPHGRIRHTQRRCDSGEPATNPSGDAAMHYLMMLGDEIAPNGISDPSPSDHRQLRLQRRGRFRLDGMVRTLRRHRPSQPHHPESAGHQHGSQTPRRNRQRRRSCTQPTGSIRRGSGAKCACPIRPTRRPRLRANRSTRFTPASRKTSTKPTRSFPTAIRT